MARSTHETSRLYAVTQTALLSVFALCVFLDRGQPLLRGGALAGRVGTVLAAAGLLLMLLAFRSLGRAIQIAPEPRADAHLVTSGVYGRFRHPIYTGILAAIVGLVLRKPTPLVAVLAAVSIAFLLVKARFEERLLLERYPDYGAYMRRAWGVVPWPRRTPGDG